MKHIKFWIDDLRTAPADFMWIKTVKEAIIAIQEAECMGITIDVISMDHDAGDYAYDGGDYIKLLDWLEETGRNYPIRIHSQNSVGIANMRRIIRRNGWKEVF